MQLTIEQNKAKLLLLEQVEYFFREALPILNSLQKKQLVRLQVPIDNLNLLQWLSHQPFDGKTYWRNRRNSFEMAGVGEADVVTGNHPVDDTNSLFFRLKKYLTKDFPDIRYYGGIRFRTRKNPDENWRIFGAYRFTVPKFEIYSEKQQSFFAYNFLLDPSKSKQDQLNECLLALEKIRWDYHEIFSEIPRLSKRSDFPDRIGWQKAIESAFDLFKKKQVDKIVLARRTKLLFDENLNGVELLTRLQQTDPHAFHFCFQPDKNFAFIGGTPERLFWRQRRELISEALAGTRSRGKSPEIDQAFEKELLNSEKDIREHKFVLDSIYKSLKEVCEWINVSEEVTVLKLSKLQHLYTTLKGCLKRDINDGQILSLLHPTPAVGGYPKKEAIENIDDLETFDRGWYAGPVGWVSTAASEFAVAIRSGLIAKNCLYLYSGAGIVPGSSAEREWEEIESKIANFIKVLN